MESTVSVGATDMQQPMFYILLHDYFISHLLREYITLSQGIKLNPQMILNTLNFTLTVTLFVYPFKTDVGYSV
jgi:hypothetical protein